jgi:hypothetical protein
MNKAQPSMERLAEQLDHTMGHIRGKITDINGKEIEESKIWIRETGQSTYSDKYGNFVMINIPPALYTVVIEHEGYSLSVSPDLPILLGDNPGHLFVLCTCAIPQNPGRAYFPNELVLQM